MNNLSSRSIIATIFSGCLTALAPPISAMDYSVSLSADNQYDTDGGLNGRDQEELESSIGLGLNISQDNQRLDFTGNYSLNYLNFDNNTSSDRSQITGNSDFVLSVIEQRFDWLAAHNITETSPSRREANNTADDQERRQQLTTGPFVTLPITGVDQLILSAEYSEIFFSKPKNTNLQTAENDDTQSLLGSINWEHALSEITDITAGYQYQESERDDREQNLEFHRYFIGFSRSLRNLNYSLSVGSNTSEQEGQSSNRGLFYQADISKQSGANTFSASASRQLTESSLGLNSLRFDSELRTPDTSQLGAGQTLDNSTIDGAVEITFLSMDYTSTALCKLCSYGAELSYIDSDYENEASEDDVVNAARLFFNYRLSTRLTAEFQTGIENTEFLTTDQTDDRSDTSLYFSWNASPRLNIRAGGGYAQEDSETDPSNGSYDNYYASISFDYQLITSRLGKN